IFLSAVASRTNQSCASASKRLLQHEVMRRLLSAEPIGSVPQSQEEGTRGVLRWLGHADEGDTYLRDGSRGQGRSRGQGGDLGCGNRVRVGEGAGGPTNRRGGADGDDASPRSCGVGPARSVHREPARIPSTE